MVYSRVMLSPPGAFSSCNWQEQRQVNTWTVPHQHSTAQHPTQIVIQHYNSGLYSKCLKLTSLWFHSALVHSHFHQGCHIRYKTTLRPCGQTCADSYPAIAHATSSLRSNELTLASWTSAHSPQNRCINRSMMHVPSIPFCSRIFWRTLNLHQMFKSGTNWERA